MRFDVEELLGVTLFADPAGGDPRFSGVKPSGDGTAPVVEDEADEEEVDETEEEEVDTDSETEEEDDEEEEVVPKTDYDKIAQDLDNSRKAEKHKDKILKKLGIDTKLSVDEAVAKFKAGDEAYEGPSSREISTFKKSVKTNLKAAGYDDELAEVLASKFDIDSWLNDEDDEYVKETVEELDRTYGKYKNASSGPKVTTRKKRSDTGIPRNGSAPKKKTENVTDRFKSAGLM